MTRGVCVVGGRRVCVCVDATRGVVDGACAVFFWKEESVLLVVDEYALVVVQQEESSVMVLVL